jgi:precorrin-3B C17-methyltransferase
VGYGTYVELIRSLVADQAIIQTGMTKEVDRVSSAIDLARKGNAVALISSGDPGIYAMAGLAFEICAAHGVALKAVETLTADHSEESDALAVEVVPGIPALCAGAALLGAPLTHDFAAVSMSDLLTPWEVIEKRIHAAAGADFVMVIYNPKSKKRHWQLEKAQKITLGYRSGDTPVGLVTKAMRKGQHIEITTLAKLHTADVNMQTTVFIGNSTTAQYGDFLFTLRGYGKKYAF